MASGPLPGFGPADLPDTPEGTGAIQTLTLNADGADVVVSLAAFRLLLDYEARGLTLVRRPDGTVTVKCARRCAAVPRIADRFNCARHQADLRRLLDVVENVDATLERMHA